MLTLVLGRAGAGKTAFVLGEIRRRMEAGESELLMIVPEQYSHDAEKQLCAVCGDRLSQHGETLSFTRLYGRVLSEAGSAPPPEIDCGGQMLVMHSALESAAPELKVYGAKVRRTQFLESLLEIVKEFKSCGISPDMLERAAERTQTPLKDKLSDLTLIYSAYESILHSRASDPLDRLTMLADMIGCSTVGRKGHIYFDGFNDFTAQEFRVIEKLMGKNADMTVCLTCGPQDAGEVFELPRKTAVRLRRIAAGYGVEVADIIMDAPAGARAEELAFLERRLFDYGEAKFPGTGGEVTPDDSGVPAGISQRREGESLKAGISQSREAESLEDVRNAENTASCQAIALYSAPTRYAECEYAAHTIWELVRGGYRWRDIGVMARDWEEYGSICENVFEKYGVPYFSGGRTDILNKPPVALITAALEAAVYGWEYRPVFSYLKTGLAGVTAEDCFELENYVLKWNIRGAMWERDWKLPASGYGGELDESALMRINDLRRWTAAPLSGLRRGIIGLSPVREKLKSLYAFIERIKLSENLKKKSDELEKRGEARLADEYAQLWHIVKNAMEQMFEILGDTAADAVEFQKLFTLVVSQYNVGVIPVSLDRTALGGMAMSRRRDLKCLILLGATDEKLPLLAKSGGLLSDSERDQLKELGEDMPTGIEDRIHREMNMLYSTLTLPSQKLVLMYPAGSGARPSFIVKRIKSLFGISEVTLRREDYMTAAETPYRELVMMSGGFGGEERGERREERGERRGEWRVESVGEVSSGRALIAGGGVSGVLRSGALRGELGNCLSAGMAERLYGSELSMSPSRVEKYYSCPFQHFLYSGLRLAPRIPADFDAPQSGIFYHYVLDGVAREIKETTGFKNAAEEQCRALTERFVQEYARDILHGFEGKNTRFIYLFRRLEDDVRRVALDMIGELKCSEFEPLDFEYNLSDLGSGLPLSGIIDRVDGWEHDGKLYLRVIDYKTGKKTFDLTGVLHGMDMQMLIYLFALQKYSPAKQGALIAPAGVLYVPARDVLLKAPRNSTEEEIKKKRENELRRTGLILNEPYVLEAMESGEAKKYLPVKQAKDGGFAGESLVTLEQLSLLESHVGHMVHRAAKEILGGGAELSPYYKSAADNACLYCRYRSVCGFDEDAGDKRRFIRKIKTTEAWEAVGERREES